MPNALRRQRVSCVLFVLFSSCLSAAFAQVTPSIPPLLTPPVTPPTATTATPFDTLRWQADDEIRRTQDPELKRVPYERLDDARAQLAARQQSGNKTGIAGVTWQERGPTNVGGVTRAVLFDLNDPARKKAWAGSVGGGLWYTNDITDATANWVPVGDNWENLNISALAADPSNPLVMYAGTGDGFSSYSAPNGGGIWKTADGGTTWTRLTSTIPASAGTPLQIAFGSIMKIVVSTNGVVFAATRYGVVRSADGGSSWQFVLAPQQAIGGVSPLNTSGAGYIDDFTTDLEIGSDNILYAGFRNGRVFRATSTAGTAWTEITPPNTAPYNGTRVELALAPSTNGSGQVVYAIATFNNAGNYNQDVKWFNKTVNGGSNWSSVTIPVPTYSTTSHFTQGTGSNALVLSVIPDSPNTIYVGGSGVWYRSTDGGQNWPSSASTFVSLHNMAFSGPKTAIWGTATGPRYLVDLSDLFGNPFTTPYPIRSNNYRTSEVNGVALRNAVNNSTVLVSTELFGAGIVTASGAAPITKLAYSNSGIPYVDQNQPNIALSYGGYQSVNVYDLSVAGSFTTVQFAASSPNSAADYDSQNNVFYAYQNSLQKITGVGSTNQVVSLNTYISGTPTCIKAGKAANTVFMAGSTGLLYKVTNTDQATPTLVRIDNDALPTTANINCIEVGADDNELLLVLSNYGVRSVWYTSNGGQNWISKDEVAHGLPDMPIRWALFNPANRKQVMLATELGIWSTNDITAANPGWQPTLTGMPIVRCNMLRHRTADGRVVVATQGRGVWETNVWATSYTLPTLTIASLSSTSLCVNGTVSVSVALTNGTVGSGNYYTLYLSDATGSFANPYKLATGTTTSLTATVPTYINGVAVSYSTNYRVKVVASDPEVETTPSGPITIGTTTYVSVITRELPNYGSATVCPGSAVDLFANFSGQRDLPGQYEWRLDGAVIGGAVSGTVTVSQPGTYQLIFRQGSCQAGNTYGLSNSTLIYGNPVVTNGGSLPGPQCAGQRTRLVSTYAGKSAVYQWQLNGLDLPGATQYAYEATQNGNYTFTLRDAGCPNAGISYGALLQFGQNLAATIAVSSSVVCSGFTTFLYIQEYGTAGYTYQWQRDGMDIAGATYYYYYAGPGVYTVKVGQGNCNTVSNAVTIQSGIPVITLSGVGKKQLCVGDVRTLYTSSIPNYGSSYQWQKDGTDIPGATSSAYSVTATGTYRAKVTAGSCAAVSPEAAYQTGNTFVPDIYPYNAEACAGSVNGASLNTNYSAQNTYQWSRDGLDIPGATQSGYSANRAGTYGVRVTTGTGCSGTVFTSVKRNGLPKPTISTTGPAQRCYTSAIRLTGSYYNGADSYQWKLNGVAIPGATNYYQLYAVESGLYTLVVKQATCESESDPIDVRIGDPLKSFLTGNALVTPGQSVPLSVSFTGSAPWSFTLSDGQTVQNTFTNPYPITVTPATATTYQLNNLTNTCGQGMTFGRVQIRVGSGSADVSLSMQVSNRTPAVFEVVSYSVTLTNAGPQAAQNVVVTNTLPAGLSFIDTPSGAITTMPDGLTINAGTVPVGIPVTYVFRARAIGPGVFINAAQITDATTPDPDSQPGSGTGDGQDDAAQVDFRTKESSDRIMVSANANQTPLPPLQSNQPVADPNTADLSLAVQVDNRAPNVANSDVVTATLTVRNRGGASASNVVVQIVLPNGLFDYQNIPGWTPVTENRVYTGFINLIPAGGEAKLTFRWQPSGSGVVKAQVVSMYETDPDSTPGNGIGKGEDDEAAVDIRAR